MRAAKMIDRNTYLERLHQYRDKPLIKVLSGMRRSGKSTILQLFHEDLVNQGITKPEQIIAINFEDMAYRELLTADALYEYLLPAVESNERLYLFLDEIQMVAEFERVVDSLFIQPNIDLYITGSNAKFLSSDLATLLTGRYIEIKVYPLSFSEYVGTLANMSDINQAYNDYVTYGSLPEAVNLFQDDPALVPAYMQSVYRTVIYNDILSRYGIRDDAKLNDVAKYLFDNIGNLTSPKRISDFLTSSGRPTANHTVESYITALADSFLVYSASRYDIRGKKMLKTNQKHYLVDTAFRWLLSDSDPSDYGRVLENVVYLELLRRYDKVWVGKQGSQEIDFVTRDLSADHALAYYQVALSVRDDSTRQRELNAIDTKDNYPKTILTLDPEEGDYQGIRQRNALKWLLDI